MTSTKPLVKLMSCVICKSHYYIPTNKKRIRSHKVRLDYPIRPRNCLTCSPDCARKHKINLSRLNSQKKRKRVVNNG